MCYIYLKKGHGCLIAHLGQCFKIENQTLFFSLSLTNIHFVLVHPYQKHFGNTHISCKGKYY